MYLCFAVTIRACVLCIHVNETEVHANCALVLFSAGLAILIKRVKLFTSFP